MYEHENSIWDLIKICQIQFLSYRNFASGLPAQINAGISIGLSGMPFSGSDIGGFEWYVDSSPPDLELWSRWTEAGCFSGLMHEQGLSLYQSISLYVTFH